MSPLLRSIITRALFLCPLLANLSCSGGGGSDSEDGSTDGGTFPVSGSVAQFATVANGSGLVDATLVLPAGTNKASITAVTEASGIRFNSASGDQGVIFFSQSSEEISLGQTYQTILGTISIPSRSLDPNLSSTKLRVSLTAINEDSRGALSGAGEAPVTLLIRAKSDSDLNSGSMTVNLFLVGDVPQDPALRPVIDQAKARMADTYRDDGGITVSFNEFPISGPAIIPSPYDGSSFYEAATASAPAPAVNIFMGADIGGSIDGLLGVAGSIPGPSFASKKSAVAVSVVVSAGGDGSFSEEDTRVLGETFAHETGHFMGLYHPVDFNPATAIVTNSDPLTDTPECRSQSACLQDDSLVRNLMFPFPVGDGTGSYIPQQQLTGQQRGVLNRYIAVD